MFCYLLRRKEKLGLLTNANLININVVYRCVLEIFMFLKSMDLRLGLSNMNLEGNDIICIYLYFALDEEGVRK